MVVSLWETWRVRALTQAPLLVLVAILVRSTTGSSLELAQFTVVVFLALAIKAAQVARSGDEGEPADTGPGDVGGAGGRPGEGDRHRDVLRGVHGGVGQR